MALRKLISRTLDVGIVGVYTPIVLMTAPMLVMNPFGIVTVVPSICTFTLIGQDHNVGIGLKVGALSLPVIFYLYDVNDDRKRVG